jgi:ribosome-binding protein aMBF1 (putative translation factor)
MHWTFQTFGSVVDREILALPADMQGRLLRLGELIEQSGLQSLPRDSVKHLEDKLWELRVTGRDGIARAIYVTAAGRRAADFCQEDAKDAASRTGDRPAAGQGDHMTKLKDLKAQLLKDPAVRMHYDAMEEEFALMAEVAKARARAGLSQAELARRMKTTQSTIARLESGRGKPSTRTLDRFAKATGHKLKISFEPVKKSKAR